MIKIAIVGNIGSGKSYISRLFSCPVFNADKEVARIYKTEKDCFYKLKKKLPNYFSRFPIQKDELINCILDKKNNLKKITKIIHPIIRKKLLKFLKNKKKNKFVVLDVPLYLENKLNSQKDVIIFIESKRSEIEKRLIKRKNFNRQLFNRFKKIQLSIEKKKKKANYVIKNDFSKKTAQKYVKSILKNILK